MASRTSTRRPVPSQLSVSAEQRPTVNVEEWEAMAPLSELAVKSINAIKAASEVPPLPFKFSSEEAGPSRPSTPNQPGTAPSTHALHPKQPVQTPQQFYDWFALVDRSVSHSQEAHFRAHVANVAEHLETCDRLLGWIDEVDQEVDKMLEGWRGVEEGGKSLKDACERLLEDRDKLLEMTEEIGSRLEYFQELEYATRMLNHPGESLVLQTDFLYMVERVDICIDFLKTHRHFREAEVYLLRYQQCMTRAMTLIKMFFVGSLRALSSDVSKRMAEKMHLLYTRFKSVTPQLAPLLGELERRARVHPDELSALLAECHSAYFAARKSLLINRLTEEIRGLDPERTELVELTRAGCSYLKQLCTDEFNLYREFFDSGEELLYQYLENLCDYLYDDLRPRILHEPRLTALCEVCTVLQALMVLDLPGLQDHASDEDEDADEPAAAGKPRGLGRLHISHLLQMVLQDAQTRLFFKAQAIIQSDIRYYAPGAEDLMYPDKLVAVRKPTSGNEIKEKENINQIFRLPSLDKQDTWYPTLKKTVWVLSQLHDFVKPAIFDDIAQEAVSLCRQSLVAASNALAMRHPATTTLDGRLFLVRHLLILKEITQNLDLVQRDVEPSIDFSGVTDTLALMLSKTTAMLPDRLFTTLGMPRSNESIKEAKHDIDHELRRACEGVIDHCASTITQPLIAWTARVRDYAPPKDAPTAPLVTQPWAQQSAAEELDANFRQACQDTLRINVNSLRLYLEDSRTVEVLVTHIRERIVDEYAAFRDVVWGMYAGAMRETVLPLDTLRELLEAECTEE
ncbi:Sec34-like family-domain-containing protein [Infundibulicybe gibba]|nr:Sec34-like family-domain-containing protein [Infundibulicybe gibba]